MNNDNISNNSDKKSILNIDRIIHEPARYLIMTNLYVVDSMDFVFLKNQTGMTQGNLGAHLLKLEKVGYINIKKKFVERKPRTILAISEKGKEAFEKYKAELKNMLI